ncbi:hypothetical protein MMC10_011211 [Thelotrema lepadinum]|nr:hypothetical protein [Thelotrema lepadinum]
MTKSVGVQLSLELTRLPQLLSGSGRTVTSIINYARELRKSGSDVVTEADLRSVFGRMRIEQSLSDQFRDAVKTQNFAPLENASEIRLDSGAGPTMQNALRETEYLSTVIQLSMLAYFHNRSQLATMISDAMSQRFDENVPDSLPSPGQDTIINTLGAISSQSCAFAWSYYSQEVEQRLRQSIPGYSYDYHHSRISLPILLGAMDFLCITQSLPEDRKISLPSESGCIPMIIWAHFVLGFTVVVQTDHELDLIFGSSKSPHMYIKWRGEQPRAGNIGTNAKIGSVGETAITLHEKDMTVIIERLNDNNLFARISTEERHPIHGYGTDIWRRILNTHSMTSDSDPIYQEAAQLVIALGITMSRRLVYGGSHGGIKRFAPKSKPELLEVWRILKAGFLMFEGIEIDEEAVQRYVEYFKDNAVTEESLPNSFAKFLKAAHSGPYRFSPAFDILLKIGLMVKVLLLLSHISNVEQCSMMPILFDGLIRNSLDNEIANGFKSTSNLLYLKPYDILSNVASLISSSPLASISEPAVGSPMAPAYLFSDFGWSIFFDVVGEKDPTTVNWMVVHMKEGVPTKANTNERRPFITDGSLFAPLPGLSYPEDLGPYYLPRAVGASGERKEYWTVTPYSFNLSLIYQLSPSSDFKKKVKKDILDLGMGYGGMMLALYSTSQTPACEHTPIRSKSYPLSEEQMVKLGPDAAVMLGWHVPSQYDKGTKVMVLLTRGVPCLRWYALFCAHGWQSKRHLMLVTHDSCESCALEYTASLPDKWSLIL